MKRARCPDLVTRGRGTLARSLSPEAVGQTLGARKSCAIVTTRPLRAESFRSRNALVGWLCGSHAVGDIACCRSRTSRNLCPTASPRSRRARRRLGQARKGTKHERAGPTRTDARNRVPKRASLECCFSVVQCSSDAVGVVWTARRARPSHGARRLGSWRTRAFGQPGERLKLCDGCADTGAGRSLHRADVVASR
jgi:hypothetical protein